MNKNQQEWDQRSQDYGDKIEGVLFKSFHKKLNNYLDKWMLSQVKSLVVNKSKTKILDLGCGYGRLSEPLLKTNSEVSTVGVDIAREYIRLYNKNLGPRAKGYKADISKLPFKDASFDGVFMVTTLMYKTNLADQRKSMKEVFRVLKPQGQFVIIERNPVGHDLITLKGLSNRLKGQPKSEIDAVGFTKNQMVSLVSNSGGDLNKVEGIAVFTLFLPILVLVSKMNKNNLGGILALIEHIDKLLKFITWSSLYISYKGTKSH